MTHTPPPARPRHLHPTPDIHPAAASRGVPDLGGDAELERYLTHALNDFMGGQAVERIPMPQPPRTSSAPRWVAVAAAVLLAVGTASIVRSGGTTQIETGTAQPAPDGVLFNDRQVAELMGNSYQMISVARSDGSTAQGVGYANWLAGTITPSRPCSDPCPIGGIIDGPEAAALLGSGQYQLIVDGDTVTLTRDGEGITAVTFKKAGQLLRQDTELAALAEPAG